MSVFTTKCLLTSLGVAGRHSVRPGAAAAGTRARARAVGALLQARRCVQARQQLARQQLGRQLLPLLLPAGACCVLRRCLRCCVPLSGRGGGRDQLGAQGRRWAAGPLSVCALGARAGLRAEAVPPGGRPADGGRCARAAEAGLCTLWCMHYVFASQQRRACDHYCTLSRSLTLAAAATAVTRRQHITRRRRAGAVNDPGAPRLPAARLLRQPGQEPGGRGGQQHARADLPHLCAAEQPGAFVPWHLGRRQRCHGP